MFERLLNGRPMTLEKEKVFVDKISGKPVHRYVDCFGRRWLASNRWGWFRVRRLGAPKSRSSF